jgi:hypothetical protein
MVVALRENASVIARFEKMDPNSSRFLKVNKGIDETLVCYREIYEENIMVTVQSYLNKFVRKGVSPTLSTSPQPSTTYAPSVPLPADGDADD